VTTSANCKESLSYSFEKNTFYRVASSSDLQQLSSYELQKLKNQKEIRQVSQCLTKSGRLFTEVTLRNPDDLFPRGMKNVPIKTIYSREKSVL